MYGLPRTGADGGRACACANADGAPAEDGASVPPPAAAAANRAPRCVAGAACCPAPAHVARREVTERSAGVFRADARGGGAAAAAAEATPRRPRPTRARPGRVGCGQEKDATTMAAAARRKGARAAVVEGDTRGLAFLTRLVAMEHHLILHCVSASVITSRHALLSTACHAAAASRRISGAATAPSIPSLPPRGPGRLGGPVARRAAAAAQKMRVRHGRGRALLDGRVAVGRGRGAHDTPHPNAWHIEAGRWVGEPARVSE